MGHQERERGDAVDNPPVPSTLIFRRPCNVWQKHFMHADDRPAPVRITKGDMMKSMRIEQGKYSSIPI